MNWDTSFFSLIQLIEIGISEFLNILKDHNFKLFLFFVPLVEI